MIRMVREDETKKPLQRVVRPLLACSLIWGGTAAVAVTRAGSAVRASAATHRPTAGRDTRPAPSHGAPSGPVVLLPPYAVYAASSRRPAVVRERSARYGAPGLTLAPQDKACAPPPAHHSSGRRSTTPSSVDLSRYDPPVADEGPVHAGAAWATAYTLLGWWAAKDGLAGKPFAPMSVYAQLARGKNRPVAFADALALEQRQGVDTQADYWQGDADYWNAPTRAERANAAYHRIAGYTCVYRQRHSSVSARTAIEDSLAGGQPLALGLPVDERFVAASAAEPLVDLVGRKSPGAEAVVAVAYDGNGVWVENQWGSGWGLYGYAELSWRFVNASVAEAWTISVRPPARRATAAAGTPVGGATAVTPYTSTPPISATPTAYPSYTTYTTYASCPTATSAGGYPDYAASPTPYGVPTPTATSTATATPAPGDTAGATPTAASITACTPNGEAYAYPTSVATYPTYPTDASAYATPYAYPTTDTSAYVYSTPYAYPTYPTDTATATSTPASPTPTATEIPTATATATSTPRVKAQVADLPASGPAGATIYVAGSGFGPGAVLVYWNNSPAGLAFTDGDKFSLGITAPAGAPSGAATITCVNAATNVSASTTFTVVAGQATPAGPTFTPIPTPTAPTPSATATTPTPTSTP